MQVFQLSRNVELSLLYYLETIFASNWSNITLVKAFKQVYSKDIALPVVAVSLIETASTRREIGNTELEDRFLMSINIFATSDGMRLDLASFIKNYIKEGWVHYDHSHASGSYIIIEKVANGRDFVTEFVTDSRVDLGDIASLDKKDQYRHTIIVQVRKSS